jgi:hypothetical protein
VQAESWVGQDRFAFRIGARAGIWAQLERKAHDVATLAALRMRYLTRLRGPLATMRR